MTGNRRAFAGSALAAAAGVALLLLARPVVQPAPEGADADAQEAAVGAAWPSHMRFSERSVEPPSAMEPFHAPGSGAVAAGNDAAPPAAEAMKHEGRRNVRPIAPEIVAPPLPGAALLRRTGPRPPLGVLGTAGPALPRQRRPETWRLTRLGRPAVISSSQFRSGLFVIGIEGVEGVDRGRVCTGESGRPWPCGEEAAAAFAALLVQRGGLRCRLPRLAGATATTTCRVGGQDVGAWLAANGWALALPGGPYGKAEEVARKAKMGIFGPPPPAMEAEAAVGEE